MDRDYQGASEDSEFIDNCQVPVPSAGWFKEIAMKRTYFPALIAVLPVAATYAAGACDKPATSPPDGTTAP